MEAYDDGDYSWLSALLEPAARALVAACAPAAGQHVLDVGAGDGSVALHAARRGAESSALDSSPRQVERGRARTAGAPVAWVVGDAEALPYADRTFDAALSSFGVIYAARPAAAAAELFRVLRPGGVAGLTAWPPDGFNARLQAAVAAHAGAGDEPRPEEAWGTDAGCRALLASHARSVDVRRAAYVRSFASAQAMWEEASTRVPPLVAIGAALGPERFARLGEDYRRVVAEHGATSDGTLRLEVDHLLVVARK